MKRDRHPGIPVHVEDLESCVYAVKAYAMAKGMDALKAETTFSSYMAVYRKRMPKPDVPAYNHEFRRWYIERNIYATKRTLQDLANGKTI